MLEVPPKQLLGPGVVVVGPLSSVVRELVLVVPLVELLTEPVVLVVLPENSPPHAAAVKMKAHAAVTIGMRILFRTQFKLPLMLRAFISGSCQQRSVCSCLQ